jgi:hypothetical protein
MNTMNLCWCRVTGVTNVPLQVTRHAFSTQDAVGSLLFLHLGLTRGLRHLLQIHGQIPSLEDTYGKLNFVLELEKILVSSYVILELSLLRLS